MKRLAIKEVCAREILDSRGNPTIEAEVTLECGAKGRAAAPSGASTGMYEALELRDRENKRYGGKGVLHAVNFVNKEISRVLNGMDCHRLYEIDHAMIDLDGTAGKKRLGANAILAVSIACARAAATAYEMPLWQFLGGIQGVRMPVPMMNILNGGAHAANTVDVQEFMLMPVGAANFKEGLQWGTEIFHALAEILKKHGFSTSVGDEGGFAPDVKTDEEAICLILQAIEKAGYQSEKDVVLALDAASSEWKSEMPGMYRLPKAGTVFSSDDLIEHWESLCVKYPIRSIEDALDEEDWEGWKKITRKLGNKVQLVGDDLFVTNTTRLSKGIQEGCANAILIKPNQIGTLSETMDAIRMAQRAGYAPIISHRSGETEDTTIADLAVAMNAGQIKTGAPSRSERVAKYNQLLRIEESLGEVSCYSD